jgi:hypothetical protein
MKILQSFLEEDKELMTLLKTMSKMEEAVEESRLEA